jgi:hypothetical protein
LYCRNCGQELPGGAYYCVRCGTPVLREGSTQKNNVATFLIQRRKRLKLFAVVVILVLAVSIIGSFLYYYSIFFVPYPKSGLDTASGPACYPFNGNINSTFTISSKLPNFDEQLWLFFNQKLSSVLQYNVSAVAQNDSLGNGPGYLLNGLTDTGFWYQIGLTWNPLLVNSSIIGFRGFQLTYEVYNASSGVSIFPSVSGSEGVNFSGTVRSGDTVLLSLKIISNDASNSGEVTVFASGFDWNTKASGNISSDGYNATTFMSAPFSNFPSGLLTEWYVTSPSFCSDQKVVFSNLITPLKSATLCIDEHYNPINERNVYFGCQAPILFNPSLGRHYESYSFWGHTIYATPYQFVTS